MMLQPNYLARKGIFFTLLGEKKSYWHGIIFFKLRLKKKKRKKPSHVAVPSLPINLVFLESSPV